MRITIHLGYNKTGTTSLQRWLSDQAPTLATRGLLYPQAGRIHGAHYGLSRLLIGAPAVDCDEQLYPHWRDELQACGAQHLLVSTEYLTLASEQAVTTLRDALKTHFGSSAELRVVVYLRRHDLWFESLFNEAIKFADQPPWQLNLEDYVLHALSSDALAVRYEQTLDRWAQVFGDPAVTVRVFDPAQFIGGQLHTDFLSCVAPELPLEGLPAMVSANESLAPTYAFLIGQLRRLPQNPHRDKAISEMLIASRAPSAVELAPEGFGRFRPSQRNAIYQQFAPEYTRIRARFRPDLAGPLFSHPRSDAA